MTSKKFFSAFDQERRLREFGGVRNRGPWQFLLIEGIGYFAVVLFSICVTDWLNAGLPSHPAGWYRMLAISLALGMSWAGIHLGWIEYRFRSGNGGAANASGATRD
ncbi:hypothetical protein [Pseudoduganella namucuonensis]|uniref:Uncharacterized protein n=1 Tax=Pseudoduganella namucuonensis TaxID=1035707 RepID=A0A1I7KWI0_9BURK|nr:hypothetical protein [Pseudoduganella namucuonensis]SFV01664.1 hypothetical protein SAMN05216552_102062 [Pseudoduganella namucuonensis]